MSDLRRLGLELDRARAEHARDERSVEALRNRLRRVEVELSAADRVGDRTRADAMRSERGEVAATLETAIETAARNRLAVDRAHESLVATVPDPRRITTQLDDDTPVLLLPLRLETRFVGNELWIRAFPDDVAITAHEPALTDDEIELGKAFWSATWDASDEEQSSAWTRLVGGGATTRAAWIARVTRPLNAPPAPPEFPAIDAKASAWTAAPRSDVMPDQLVFSLYANGALAHQIVGARIPTPLPVGPDPNVQITRNEDGEIVLDDPIKWIVDFDRAVEIGLGIRVPLRPQELENGFERLVVVGVRISADVVENAHALERLLEAHRYTDSLELVPQGTPTNRTDRTAAGTGAESLTEAMERELGPPRFVPSSDPATDGERFATALGVATSALERTRHSDRHDHTEAMAMNRALWPATLGYFAEQMMSPQITPQERAEIRKFFIRFVTGRGALPALRIGNQPYGVLVTSAFSRWQPATDDGSVLVSMNKLLHRMSETWRALAQQVTRAGVGSDPERALLEVLGLHASSVTYHHRRALGADYLWNRDTFEGMDPRQRQQAHAAAATSLVQSLGHNLDGARVLALELIRTATQVTRPLIDNRPLSETHGLDPNYIEWLRGSLDAIRTESYGGPVPSAVLYVLLRHAVLLGTWDASTRLLIAHGLADAGVRIESEVMNVRAAKELTRWDHLDARIPSVTANASVADYVRDGGQGVDEAAELREQLESLKTLAPLPTARLERLFGEHLDLCSYRLDAWRLAFAAKRLEDMRARARDGIHLGAYGWLEDVRRRPPEASGGFVHAPSPTHAVTAAILRAAHLTHADPSDRARMSVDLRSSRVRRALWYIEGLRQGLDLAGMLGSRFERGLHDNNQELALEQHLVRLREAFPLVAGRVHETASGEALDGVQARNVVDGVRLLEHRSSGYPYGATDLPATSTPEASAIVAEVEAIADDMDALADLLLAEAVHQAAQGKHERANAVSSGLARGIAPAELEVVKTPRSGLAVTHRVCLLLPASSTEVAAWAGATPRSRFEPTLDRWLGRVIGPPGAIRVRVTVDSQASEIRASELGLQPIDLVYLVGAESSRLAPALERWIARAVRARDGAGDDVSVAIDWAGRDPAWDASVRTLFELSPLLASMHAIVRSRPAHAQDLTSEEGDPRQDVGELRGRLVAALADLQASIEDPERAAMWALSSATERLDVLLGRVTAAVAVAATSARPLEAHVEAARLLFGDQLNPLPRFTASNPQELDQAIGAPALLSGAPPRCLDEWISCMARVRSRVAVYENLLLLATTLGTEIEEPRVAQLPHEPSARWLGLELDATTRRDGNVLSLVTHVVDGFSAARPSIGLVVDEVTELVPNAEEITGIAYQQYRPASEPPQAMLLVVPAALGNGWQWAELQQAVIDTLELAKLRAVEPDAIARTPYAHLLPAVLAPIADRHVTLVASFERQS